MRVQGTALLVAATAFLMGLPGAGAHAALERSLPAEGAQLSVPPTQVELFFGEHLVQNRAGTFAVVYDDGGTQVSSDARIDSQDSKHLIVPLHDTHNAGAYVVFWKTTSDDDGGVTLGNFRFTVGQASATTAQQGPAVGQVLVPDDQQRRALTAVVRTSGGNGIGLVGIVAGVAGGLIAGSVLTYLAIRSRSRRTTPVSGTIARKKRR